MINPKNEEKHRWSGWPGAWCLDCGIEDQREICLADHSLKNVYDCTIHVNPPCSEPGSNRHNPYTQPA